MKSNKQFMLLSALGILMVIDDHLGNAFGAFTSIFPYNSFYMPMFVFISGYFWSMDKWMQYSHSILKKSKKMLLPFIMCTLIWQLISYGLKIAGYVDWELFGFVDIIKKIFTSGVPVQVTGAGWFIIMLFFVEIVYSAIRILIKKWNDILATITFTTIGILSVFIAHNNLFNNLSLLLLKVIFFITFFQWGNAFKNNELVIKKISISYRLIISILIGLILGLWFGDKVTFNSCAFMKSFTSECYILPFISSAVGILFWYSLSEVLTPVLGKSKLINYISNNTMFIMLNHLGMFNLLNIIVKYFAKDFDFEKFNISAWYQYAPSKYWSVLYFVFSLSLCLVLVYCINNLKLKLCNMTFPKTNNTQQE